MAGRGLEVPATPDLLFHPDLTYWDTRTGHAAMVAPVRNAAGEIVAVHRTYLADDGSGKADLPKPRMMLGPVTGGAVRLAPIGEAGVLGIAEGLETALSVMQSCPDLPVWAALSAGNIEQVQLPAEATNVVILADNDGEGAGLSRGKACRRAASIRKAGASGSPCRQLSGMISTTCCSSRVRMLSGKRSRRRPSGCRRPGRGQRPKTPGPSAMTSVRSVFASLPHCRICAPTMAIWRGSPRGSGRSCWRRTSRRGCSVPPDGQAGSSATKTAVPSLIR